MHQTVNIPATLLLAANLFLISTSQGYAEDQNSTPAQGVLVLKDGSWMKGHLIGINEQQHISWAHDASAANLSFPAQTIKAIHFSASPPHPHASDLVQLVNQMKIHGTIHAFNESDLVMTTNFNNILTIPKKAISGFILNSDDNHNENIVFNDLKPVSAWAYRTTPTPEFWSIPDDNSLVYNGLGTEFITRDVSIPQIATISFDLSWKDTLNTNIFLCHEVSPQAGEWQNNYRIDIANNSLNCIRELRTNRGSTPQTFGRVDISEHLFNKNSAHFTISIDRINRRLAIHINGELIDSWIEEQETQLPEGGSIQFRGNPNHPLIIRNLVVREWNGHVRRTNLNPIEESATNDYILIKGEKDAFKSLKSITKTDDGTRWLSIPTPIIKDEIINIPATRVDRVLLAQSSQLKPDEFIATFRPQAYLLLSDGSNLPTKNLIFRDGSFILSPFTNSKPLTINQEHVLEITFPSNE